MGAQNIPRDGEHGSANAFRASMSKVVLAQVATFATPDVPIAAEATYAIWNVKANTFVLAVFSRVVTAWTAALTMTVGDGTSAAGFLASADIAPQAAVATGIMVSSLAAAEAFANGKTYLADDTIDAVVAGAAAVVGRQELYALFTLAPSQ